MKTGDFLLIVAQGVIKTLKKELAERNAVYEKEKQREKRSEELKRNSIDVEYKVVKE